MTIVIAFDGSGDRTFKDFYTQQVLLLLAQSISQAGELYAICRIDALVCHDVVLKNCTLARAKLLELISLDPSEN